MSSSPDFSVLKNCFCTVGAVVLFGVAAKSLEEDPEITAQKDMAIAKVEEILTSPNREALLKEPIPYRADGLTYTDDNGQDIEPFVHVYEVNAVQNEAGENALCGLFIAADSEGYHLFPRRIEEHCVPEVTPEVTAQPS